MEQRKQVIPLFLIAAIVAGTLVFMQKPEQEIIAPTISVRTATISAETPTQLLQVSGTTRSSDTAQLRFQVSGRVTEKLVRLGEEVDKGDVLARIYNPEVEPRAQQAKDNLARLVAESEQAQRDFQRLDALYAEQAVTQQEWENARTQSTAKKTAVAAAEAEVTRAGQVSRELELVAPFAGSITEILVDIGEVVSVGMPAVRLTNPNAVELKLPLSDAVLGQLSLGQVIMIREALRPMAPAIQGQVIEISPFRERGSLPEVVVALDAGQIRPGTAVNAEIEVAATNTLSVPLRSVLMTGEQTTAVYRITDNVADLVAIRPIKITADHALIDQGLVPGDRVVVEGIAQLYDGAKITLIPAAEVSE